MQACSVQREKRAVKVINRLRTLQTHGHHLYQPIHAQSFQERDALVLQHYQTLKYSTTAFSN